MDIKSNLNFIFIKDTFIFLKHLFFKFIIK